MCVSRQQQMLIDLVTQFLPILDLHMFYMLKQNSTKSGVIFKTFYFDNSSILFFTVFGFYLFSSYWANWEHSHII